VPGSPKMTDLERAFRLNLSAWNLRIHPLQGPLRASRLDPRRGPIALMVGPSRSLATTNTLQIRDASTGEPIGEPFRHPAKVGGAGVQPRWPDPSSPRPTIMSPGLWNVATGSQVGPEIPA